MIRASPSERLLRSFFSQQSQYLALPGAEKQVARQFGNFSPQEGQQHDRQAITASMAMPANNTSALWF